MKSRGEGGEAIKAQVAQARCMSICCKLLRNTRNTRVCIKRMVAIKKIENINEFGIKSIFSRFSRLS